tara:strand:+ start:151 stop:882 length:732 start_codon:yes stop_codon:yes gene_type:complete
MNQDYELLGANRNMKIDEIKQLYHKKAKEHHPDKGGNSEKFKRINDAFKNIEDSKNQKGPQFNKFNNPFVHPFQNFNILNHLNVSLEELYYGFSKNINGHVINLPAGINENNIIRVPGSPISLKLCIQKHPRFTLKGKDLYLTKNVTLVEALIGYTGQIQHFKKHVKIQTETNQILHENSQFILKGWGMPMDTTLKKFGNLIINFKVVLPESFSENKHDSLKWLFDYNKKIDENEEYTIVKKK